MDDDFDYYEDWDGENYPHDDEELPEGCHQIDSWEDQKQEKMPQGIIPGAMWCYLKLSYSMQTSLQRKYIVIGIIINSINISESSV